MDAFNDLLRGGYGVHEPGEELHIKWIHFAKSRQDLGYNATTNYYREMLKKCHPTARDKVKKKLQDSINGKGKTILDEIIDSILDTNNTGHWCKLEIKE